jgi:small subunit ribosomal protein S4e
MAKLKRLLAPKFWKVPRKVMTWVVAPRAGPHKKFECIPLAIILRNILGLTETGREAKTVIKKGDIFVDGKARKEHAYPVGLMDVVSIPKLNKFYRMIPFPKGLKLIEIQEKEAKLKLLKIMNKSSVKKGKIQLNFHDGKNLIIGKDVYKTGDSVLVELPSLKIIDHVKLEKDVMGLIIGGVNAGLLATAKEIIVSRSTEPNRVVCELENKKLEISHEHFFVVGKKSPLIAVGE